MHAHGIELFGASFVALVIGAVLLSILHGTIPNHWFPIVALGRKQGWSTAKALWGTLITGTAHLSTTVAVGIVIGYLGMQLAHRWGRYELWLGSIFLILFGLWIMLCQQRGVCVHIHWGAGAHPHRHLHAFAESANHATDDAAAMPAKLRMPATQASSWSLREDVIPLGTLALMMFISPCLELDAYFLVAVHYGWLGIAAVAIAFLVVTVGTMMLIVWGVYSGLKWLQWNFLQRYEGYFSGGLLMALGVVWLLIKL